MAKTGGFLDRLAGLLFPPVCILCGEVVEYGALWCSKCPLERVERPCPHCGKSHPECLCRRNRWSFSQAAAPFVYAGNARKAVLLLKKKPDGRTVSFFAGEMIGELQKRDFPACCVVPVPVNPQKKAERGFNQAELLAGEIADGLGLPLIDALGRRDGTKIQHELDRQSRFENAKRSFYMMNPAAVEGKAVLLVDDIFTTGATAQACASQLMKTAKSVCVLTAATVYSAKKTEKTNEMGR